MKITPTPSEHDRARAAGMSPGQAARWLAYLAMKTRRGEQPITLDEAMRQIREVSRD